MDCRTTDREVGKDRYEAAETEQTASSQKWIVWLTQTSEISSQQRGIVSVLHLP